MDRHGQHAQSDPTAGRRAFLKRMAALAFAAPVISSFALDSDAFAGPSNQHGQNGTEKNPCPPNQHGQNGTIGVQQPPPNQYGQNGTDKNPCPPPNQHGQNGTIGVQLPPPNQYGQNGTSGPGVWDKGHK